MNRSWETHRWFRVAMSTLAVPAALLLMWISGQWTFSGIERVLGLPDTGGHGLEFLTLILLGAAAFLFAGTTVASNIGALAITNLFERPFSELSSRSRVITRLAFGTTGIILVMAATAGVALLFDLVLIWAI